jgi:hypothetical protein
MVISFKNLVCATGGGGNFEGVNGGKGLAGCAGIGKDPTSCLFGAVLGAGLTNPLNGAASAGGEGDSVIGHD